MSDFDARNQPSYPGPSLRRGSTVQGVWFEARMIRSRRGSALSSLSQEPYPCDSAGRLIPGHLEDPDHGGVQVTWTVLDTYTGHEHYVRLAALQQALGTSWNATGGVDLVTQVDTYGSRLQHNTSDRPSSRFNNNELLMSQYRQAVALAQGSHLTGLSTDDTESVHPSMIPSFPTEAVSTRWPSTDTAYANPPSQELDQDEHPRINYAYDVADFLEHWNIQYFMGEAGLVHLDHGCVKHWRPQNQESHRNYDIQGLDWEALRTTRARARLARKMLYPLRCPWTPPATYDEHALCRQQRMYAFRDFYPHHKASNAHGQLRNVLAARSRNDVFYASKTKVMHTSLSCPAYTNVVLNFSGSSTNPNQGEDTHITTIAVSPAADFDGYYSDAVLVTGGLEGEYSLLNLNSAIGDRPVEGFVAQEKVTTHVHVLSHRRTGALGAAFCSNDSKVRLLDIDTNSWSAEFAYENQINCAATSPDGRLRMIVGDTCDALITDAERGDVLFRTRQHTGYGFACAWAADGWHVATGSEDGKVVVYDARRWDTPLATLGCEMNCALSLHFTPSNRGGTSLVVAESDDIVSVYDAIDWNDKQTIDFFGSVVGAVSVEDGQELIVANGDETVGGMMVFERKQHIPDEKDDFEHYLRWEETLSGTTKTRF